MAGLKVSKYNGSCSKSIKVETHPSIFGIKFQGNTPQYKYFLVI